jgi:hypothetical protein
MPRKPRVPSLRRHKPPQQGVVTLSGQDHYLGRWPECLREPPPEVRAAYDHLVAEWLAAGRRLPAMPDEQTHCLCVNELILAFWRHAEQHYIYPETGKPTNELNDYRYSLKPLRELYGGTLAAEFSPLKLKAVRTRMVQSGLCRGVVNRRVARVVRAFK